MDLYKQIHPGDVDIEAKLTSLKSIIEANGITIVDLLIYAQNESNGSMQLSKRVGRSVREVDDYLKSLLAKFDDLNKPIKLPSNDTSPESPKYIRTGIEKLDQQLSGGIRIGDITEVFGGSGSGKSHFMLQLSLQCQTLGIPEENKCVYISTESPLETRRLEDMTKNYSEGISLDNILSIYCQDLENQDHILFTQLPIKLEEDPNIKLVVIDSIAHHLRTEDTISNSSFLLEKIKEQELKLDDDKLYNEIKKRNRHQLNVFFKSNEKYENRIHKLHYLLLLYRHLIRLAKSHNIAIVLANQVSDHATDIKDFGSLYDDGINLLDLDIQLGFYSGWDKRTTYKYQQALGISNSVVNSTSINQVESSLIGSLKNSNPSKKRTRINPEDFDPRFAKNTTENKDDEESYNQHKMLLLDLHYLTGGETKKYVPTLNYHWGKHMVSRIMIMKSYKPLIKDKKDIFEKSHIDPESGLSYDDLMDGFNKSASQRIPKRPLPQQTYNNTVESILKGWQVQRFIKVISSPYDVSGTNNNRKIPFVISKNGLLQI